MMTLMPRGVVTNPAGDTESQLPPEEVEAVAEKLKLAAVLPIAKTWGSGSGAA
jgi:hypothetical protein